MKNLVKLFALALVGITLFSCTTDEYDAALEESVKVTENRTEWVSTLFRGRMMQKYKIE